ncbi:hypothetical protein BP6252_14129 [Coleophoma cylindrospora]|uniref:Glycoside hydrolase family 35 protein n=1 Tax=Coleophoma cylindrospora TaxID=1849047 RepID=A0A3D8Q3S2_9HELO|nr:hypothetical protein BP6252_14129 [Coleophoma cylindrospora]
MAREIPYLEATYNSKQLIVHGKPFLIRGAELHNSSLSSAEFMNDVWAKLSAANINTVLGATTWEQIEPEEGKFDFTELDKVIEAAREHGLHLILLWFGSFKNGFSAYTPAWVKTNQKRFPRAKLRKEGGRMEIGNTLSIFHPEAPQADLKAFTALMQHLKTVDEKHSTVIMVQVENEVGLIGDSRDGSAAANKIFNSPVPDELLKFLVSDWANLNSTIKANLAHFKGQTSITNTSWESVFGSAVATDELFMAYHYAIYLERIAAAGKAAYPIPHFTNVWLGDTDDVSNGGVVSGGTAPGVYPSGGGVAPVLDIWQKFAPTFDIVTPDIYMADYKKACATYRHRNQPLFIPEQRRDEYGARRIWYAFGSHQAMGTAPFGIDTLDDVYNPFIKHYGLLKQVSAHVLASQRRPNSSVGFFFDEPSANGGVKPEILEPTLGGWQLKIERSFTFGKQGPGFGMIIHLHDSQFLLIGEGFQVSFTSLDPEKPFSSLLHFDEKEVVNVETGEMRTLRMLNGDETKSGRLFIMPGENPDYGGYPVSVTIPARTRIAVCEPYALEWDDPV